MSLIPLSIDDFSGGFTDNYLAGPVTKCFRNNNFLITSNRKPRSRPGSVILDSTNYQIPGGNARIGNLFNFSNGDTLLSRYGRKLYAKESAAAYSTLTGPASYDAFPSTVGDGDPVISSPWKKHTYFVTDDRTRPIKVYKDSGGVLRVRAAGLDAFEGTTSFSGTTPSDSMVDLANDLRTKFKAHYTDTSEHTTGSDTVSNAIISLSALSHGCTLAQIIALTAQLQLAYRSHYTDAVKPTGSRSYHANTLGNYPGTPNVSPIYYDSPETLLQVAQVLNELRKIYTWHITSFRGHPASGGHTISESALSGVDITPTFTRNLTPALSLVNEIKSKFNSHIRNSLTGHAVGISANAGGFGIDSYNFATTDVNTGTEFITISAGHHLEEGQDIFFTTTSALPTGLTANTIYYAKSVTSTTLQVAATPGGSAINLSTVGTGTHTLYSSRDYVNIVTASDATDLDTLFYLTTILGAAYRSHNADLMLDVYTVSGTTVDGTPTVITDILSSSLQSGMFVGKCTSFPGGGANDYPKGTVISSIDSALHTVTVSKSHDSGGASPSTPEFRPFSFRKYHNLYSSSEGVVPSKELYILDEELTLQSAYVSVDGLHDYIQDIAAKYNKHDSASHVNNSLNQVADNFVDITLFSYLYAFVYSYTYTTEDGIEFIDRSRPQYASFQTFKSVEENPTVITNLPSLGAGISNTPTHFDTGVIQIEVYRTLDNETAYFLAGAVTNGTSTFTDAISDEVLVVREPIYTSGGVVENDPPPMAKSIHIVENVGYYGNVTVDGVTYPNRLMQAIPGSPGAVPGDFFDDLDTDITLISSARSRPIVVTQKSAYRIEGQFDEFGRGAITHERISDTGSDCPQSAVQAEDGVFYFATDGVYFTDGYKAMRINDGWPVTYKALISDSQRRRNIQGTFDEKERRIYWTVQKEDGSGDCDTLLVLDLQWGILPDSSFLTWSGGTNFRPAAILNFDGSLLRGDTRGYVFKHDDATLSDPKINTATAPSTWSKSAVIYDYISCAADFGHPKVRKFIPSMELFLKNDGNISLQIYSINDDQGTSAGKALKPIRYRDQYSGIIREERFMPAGGLRCSYKQIQLTNAIVIIDNSDTLGNASVNKMAHTVTLDSAVSEDWDADAVDWIIYFDKKNLGAGNVADNYQTGYPVTVRTDDTLTFTDGGTTAPSGSVKWILKGIPKDEYLEIIAINMNAKAETGSTQMAYQASETGANA